MLLFLLRKKVKLINKKKENKSEKKVGRNEKCPCGSENLNIATKCL